MTLSKFAQSAAERLSAYNWRIESKFQAAALASEEAHEAPRFRSIALQRNDNGGGALLRRRPPKTTILRR
jgi:hypothetical protein